MAVPITLIYGTAKQFVGMTATLINGYSSGIFHLLYRIVPGLMQKDGKSYRRPSDFDAEYGVVENTYEVRDGDYNSNRRTTKRKTKSKKLPGVSPLVFSRFLLEYTAFLSLSDMGKDLPDYEEIPVPLRMPEKVSKAYSHAEGILQRILKSNRKAANKLLSAYLNLLTVYPDQPYDQPDILDPLSEGKVVLLYYADTMQAKAMKLMASKLAVAGIIEGTFSEEGLAAMSDVKDLTSQMAKELALGIKDNVAKLCEDLDIPYSGGKRLSVSDAFRSATGDIQERIPVTRMGESHIYLAYCRDNKRTSDILSRELVKETLNQRTNQYEKLANISYDKRDGSFRCENLVLDDVVDVRKCCRQAEELFELYQRCANRKQVEGICANFLRSIEATKLSINGYLYFVPRTFMEKVDTFEEFIGLLSGLNQKEAPLMVNSFYIIDDEKQRGKMTEEFYAAVRKEIAEYQERADYFIQSGCQSPAVLERWALKIQGLEERKRHYEQVLRRELDGLDDEFGTLKFMGQELQNRAKDIRFQKAA